MQPQQVFLACSPDPDRLWYCGSYELGLQESLRFVILIRFT